MQDIEYVLYQVGVLVWLYGGCMLYGVLEIHRISWVGEGNDPHH